MASKVVKPALIKNITRGYGAQAAAATQQPTLNQSPQDPKVTTLPSGTVVASLENNSPVSRVALFFKGGSRYETVSSKGASHQLRSCAGLATNNMSMFAITRTVQQAGATLAAESGRDHIAYCVDVIRDNLDVGLEVLSNVGTQPQFKAWEVKDNLARLKYELAQRDPATFALDLLHSAAYRNTGLANSIFVPPHKLTSLSTNELMDFFSSTHLGGRLAVVGVGVDHQALVQYAGSLGLASGEGATGASQYGGGEVRQENAAPVTFVTVAGQGASVGSGEGVALAVGQQILGVGPATKYGTNASSVLAKAVAASGVLGAASAININYADSGLFGYFIMADSSDVDKVVGAVHAAVTGLKVTDEDVAAGKKRVKAAIMMASEVGGECLEDMGLQTLLTGKYNTPAAAAAAVDAVTTGTVQAALKKVLGGKLSMGVLGNVSKVPYLDQL